MLFHFNFYSSLLLIFFVHGVVYTLLLFRKARQQESIADRWLSAFLALSVLYIAPWMLGFGGWYDQQPYRQWLFYFPTQHLFLIGVVAFFYLQSLLNPLFCFQRKDFWHFLPAFLYLLYSLLIWIVDILVLKTPYFLADGEDRDFDAWYQWLGTLHIFIYFCLSLRYYQLYKRLLVQVISYADVLLFRWVSNFLWAFLLMLLGKFLFLVLAFFPAFENMNYIGSWWNFFSFALIFYYIAIVGYANTLQTQIAFSPQLLENKVLYLLPQPINIQEIEYIEIATIAENTQIEKEDTALIAEWKPRISEWIHRQKAFENPELSLSEMAKSLGIHAALLSRLINQGFGQNFNDFINAYRVAAFQEKIMAGEHLRHTFLSLAYDCGFNSKATFNRAFRKITQQTPRNWIDGLEIK